MFKHLTNFRYKRNTKEAIGFYFAYLILTALVSALSGGVIGIIMQDIIIDKFNFGVKIGTLIAVIISTGVSLLILKEKKLFGNFSYILLAIISGILAIFIGGLGGLIPAAFLTTRK